MKTPLSNMAYRQLPAFFYSDLDANVPPDPTLIIANKTYGKELGFPSGWLESDEALKVLSGQSTLGGEQALAMAYGGHQFGHWSGQLGDGRARLVGDIEGPDGRRHELHLKGSGLTPYSRRGDGKATLGSAIREYVVSEAMAALGVSTTRALSIVSTGERVHRNGLEPGAVLCRTARSHIRCGTFQWTAASGDVSNLKALADFTIERLFPGAPVDGPDRYLYLLKMAAKKQAGLIASWMGYGFIHGVMNTDNMCLSGETIDYGPCAFIDAFHPGKVFSSIDRNGRYAWNKQAELAHWNLARLAETLFPLLGETETDQRANAEAGLNSYVGHFEKSFDQVIARKFGLPEDFEGLQKFAGEAFKAMTIGRADFTLVFRHLTMLANQPNGKAGLEETLLGLFSEKEAGEEFVNQWKVAVNYQDGMNADIAQSMTRANPIIIARNHRVEQAINAANADDFGPFHKLLDAVSAPFEDRPEFKEYETPPQPDEIVHQTFCGT